MGSKLTFRQKMAMIAELEGGKSQAKFGDIMTIQALIFDQIYIDNDFLIQGLRLAEKRKRKADRGINS